MFKSQLQEYAQKAGLPAPVYDIKREGPSHEPQFKASVTIQGNTYESPASFGNLKKAEHAAAEVALAALGKSETGPLHESGLCKNLLQEYAQKSKISLPIYSVVKTEETQHSPSFIATVEIAGVHYTGQNCKTKKEAEIKAARTALVAIYADSGASSLQAMEDEKPLVHDEKPLVHDEPLVQDVTTSVEIASPESKSGGKRKRLFKGGNAVRKVKVENEQPEKIEGTGNALRKTKGEDKQPEKIEGTGNGDSLQAGNTKQANGSSSLPSGSADIGPEQELLGSKAAGGNAKIESCANGNDAPAHAKEQ